MFDCYTEQEFPPEIVDAWLSDSARYPVIIPAIVLNSYCKQLGLSCVSEFQSKYGVGLSRYFVYRRSR